MVINPFTDTHSSGDNNNPANQWGNWLGVQDANSASNQASRLSLNELLSIADFWSSKQTNAQKEIQQDFFDQQKEYNANQANIEREWQEKMANTSYQRMVQDLEKAGLNKLLAYNNNPSSIGSVGGASVGLPSSSRGGDVSNVLSSLSTNNANRQSGLLGQLLGSVGLLFSIVGNFWSLADAKNNDNKY